MPENIPFDRLVDLAKLRWRIERDYQELKQELGFGDYEGRRVARLPPPCHALYRRQRLPDRRTRRPSPLRTVWAPRSCRDLAFPAITDPEAPPIRPERHVPNSIATMRRRLIVALARTLPRCPCCNTPIRPQNPRLLTQWCRSIAVRE
jgi:hypothetical protein